MKKFIALLLSFIMVFSLIPSIALAEGDPTPTPEPTPTGTPIPAPSGTLVSTTDPYTENGTTYKTERWNDSGTLWDYYFENDIIVSRLQVEPDYDETRNLLDHVVHVDFYMTNSEHLTVVYIDGNYSEIQITYAPPDIRNGELPRGWGSEAYDPTCGGSLEQEYNDPERTNNGLGPSVTIPGFVGDYRYLGSITDGYTADIYRNDQIICFYGGEARYVKWTEGDTIGLILCGLSWVVPGAKGMELLALVVNVANTIFTGSQLLAKEDNAIFLDLIYFRYDYVVVYPEGTIKGYQRLDGYFYQQKYGSDFYELRTRDLFHIHHDGTILKIGGVNNEGEDWGISIPDSISFLLNILDIYGFHNETYTDDNDCYCNYCNTPRHIYNNPCTDTVCARCGAPRTAPDHDWVWFPAEIWGGSPYIKIGDGHKQVCSVCESVQHEELHNNDDGIWGVDQDTIYELGLCDDCGAHMQRMHDYYSYWYDPDYTCTNGGTWVTDCQNNCGYVDSVLVFDHSYSNICDEICDRCLQKTRTVLHSYTNCADINCNLCDAVRTLPPGYQELDGHVYLNCEDLTCQSCEHERLDPVHLLTDVPLWLTVNKPNVCQEFTLHCARPGCTYSDVQDTRGHSYADCADADCDTIGCNQGRGTVPGTQFDINGHVYDDCEDPTCNRDTCGFVRTTTGHYYGGAPYLFTIKTEAVCQERRMDCTIPGCSHYEPLETLGHTYTNPCTDTECALCHTPRIAPGHAYNPWQSIGPSEHRRACTICFVTQDGNHSYDNCADGYCNDCTFDRGALSGYQYGGHVFSSYCSGATCLRSGCGAKRTAPGHNYQTVYVKIHTAERCRKVVRTCTICGYSYYYYDTSHSRYGSWTRTSTKHSRTCADCTYVQSGSHSFTYIGSGILQCTICGYQKSA